VPKSHVSVSLLSFCSKRERERSIDTNTKRGERQWMKRDVEREKGWGDADAAAAAANI
jgi:hypothetical protein